MSLAPFDWRRLSSHASRFYRLAANGRIYVRGSTAPPFLASGVPLQLIHESTGIQAVATCAPDGESWELRTRGEPITVRKIRDAFADELDEVCADTGIDRRILIVQAACEAAYSSSHPSGKDLLSPRTEPGYPRRTGESDYGDPERDAEDIARNGGQHASFGLTQCLLAVAHSARPDLFEGVPPQQWRYVLREPRNAFACLAALYERLPATVADDPVAVRVTFGAGGVYPVVSPWGARLYSPAVLAHWIAHWNDLASDSDGAPIALDPLDFPPEYIDDGGKSAAARGALWA